MTKNQNGQTKITTNSSKNEAPKTNGAKSSGLAGKSAAEKSAAWSLRIHIPYFVKFFFQIFSILKNGKKLSRKKIVKLTQYFGAFIIYAVILVLPHVYSGNYSKPYEFPKLIIYLSAVSLFTVSFLLRIALWGRKKIIQSPVINALIFFLLGYILSSVFSFSPLISIAGFYGKWSLGLVSIGAFILLILGITNNEILMKNPKRLINFSLISIAVASITVALGPLFSTNNTGRIFASLKINENTSLGGDIRLANLIILGIPLNIAAIINLQKKRRNELRIALIIALAIELLILMKISLSLGILVLLFSIAFFYYRQKERLKFLKVDKLTIPILLLVIIPIVFISPLKNGLLEWFNGIYIKPAVRNSLQQLLIPLKVFTKKPLTGTGPEMLHALYPQFITKAPAENSQTIYSPNFYLQILATTGILGFSTLLLSLTLIIRRSLKSIKELSVFKASIIGSMLLWIFTRLYSYPSITELFFGAVIFASAIYLTRQKTVQSKQPRQISRVFLIFIALTAILLGYTIYSFEKAERIYAPARLNKDFAEISKTSKTIRLNPNEPTYYLAHSYNLIKLLNEDPGRSDQKEILRQFKLANRNAIALDRWRIDTYDKISDFYQILDQIYPGQNYNQHAVYYLQTAQNISPNNQFLKYQTANVYYLNNQPQPAISQLTKAIEIDHDYWEAYLFKANLLLDSQDDQDFDKAEALAETVIEKSDNTNYIEAAQNILLLIELRERS